MTTSEPPSNGGWEQTALPSTWFAEDSPAKDTQSPAGSSAPKTNGGAGPGTATSSKPSTRRGSSSRTSRTWLGPVSQISSKTLPTSGSMRGGEVCRRPPWALRISAGDSSSLLPTPAASSYGSNQGGSAGRTGKVRPSLDTMARHGLWPTPTATDSHGHGYQRRPDGTTALTLVGAVRMWPTPSASLGEHGGLVTPSKAREGGHLIEAVSARTNWPTPAARDYRHPNRKPYAERGGGTKGEQLPNAVGGALNPHFVEWLMGFPRGWTEVD